MKNHPAIILFIADWKGRDRTMLLQTGSIFPSHVYFPTQPYMSQSMILAFLPYVLVSIAAAFSGWMLTAFIKSKYGKKENPLNIILPVLVSLFLLLRFGFEMKMIQGFIFCLLLLVASNSDIRTRMVDDYIPIMVVITALIGTTISDLPMMLLSTVLITIPQHAIAVLKPNTYGGADIKLMAASAFLLELHKGLAAIVIGLSLAVICTVTIRKMQKKSIQESFALIPYLAIGCMTSFFL